ncbi:DMT family transporter [Acidaminobacter hydrogenoformans]|uniref:Permease of the drug/metabolite transporter (DMT) superfamily n=1 Tax=Acidaminobacter hydrogenoformans DSM 2784 TaxID=1120920 RepID=A0A1G5RZL1_9FIRM|nr:DMT family transporter [Acidaminobacter hydrogenoformans]SCZ79446.1 Permease of the drug/metabolite transporter (DMT) superfamily [Acidaminobacter hydrogenoformans DSM 2784]
MKKKMSGELMLMLTALIFGVSFVAQRAGMAHVGPFTFNGIRSLIGTVVLIPVMVLMDRQKKADVPAEVTDAKASKKNLLVGGLWCGLVVFISSSLQQAGMIYTTAGKAGFITALYIVIVPILGLFLKKKVRPILWVSVLLATAGLYLLSVKEGFSIGWGDFLILLSAVGLSVHIILIDHFSPKTDPVKLTSLQFLVSGVISLPFMFTFETVSWAGIMDSKIPILYAGVLSCGVAYTLQTIAQKRTEPTVTSLILSMESVIALIAGILILGESISVRETMGSIILFSGILLAQLPGDLKFLEARIPGTLGYNKKRQEESQFIEVNYVKISE